MKVLTDTQLQRLLGTNQQANQNQAFQYLYHAVFEKFNQYVQKRGGQESDVDDLLQEGLIIIYKMARQQQLDAINHIESYFFIICKNLWFQQLRKAKTTIEIDDQIRQIGNDPVVVDHLLESERSTILDQLMRDLGDNCRQLLIYFYYDRLSIREILQKMHYASEPALKNKKSKCMKQLRERLQGSEWLKNNLR